MFSTSGTTPVTATSGLSAAMAFIAATTAAPPDMSVFMRCIRSGSLSEMPPVSNVTPFPTRPRTAAFAGLAGL